MHLITILSLFNPLLCSFLLFRKPFILFIPIPVHLHIIFSQQPTPQVNKICIIYTYTPAFFNKSNYSLLILDIWLNTVYDEGYPVNHYSEFCRFHLRAEEHGPSQPAGRHRLLQCDHGKHLQEIFSLLS